MGLELELDLGLVPVLRRLCNVSVWLLFWGGLIMLPHIITNAQAFLVRLLHAVTVCMSCHPETIRLYDALELGCIPVSLSHEFLNSKDALGMIGSVPFPILDSWDQLPQFLEQMKAKALSNPDEILNLQQSCIDWWNNFKIAIQERISERIAAL